MALDQLHNLSTTTTRRKVVTTGAKLAYAAPLVAASFKLTGGSALAACGGETPYSLIFDGTAYCCGCCDKSSDRLNSLAASNVFEACQALLAENAVRCSLDGDPRVCVALDAASPAR